MIKIIVLNIILAGFHIGVVESNENVNDYDRSPSRDYTDSVNKILYKDFMFLDSFESSCFFKENPIETAFTSSTSFIDFYNSDIWKGSFPPNICRSRFLFFLTGVSPPQTPF